VQQELGDPAHIVEPRINREVVPPALSKAAMAAYCHGSLLNVAVGSRDSVVHSVGRRGEAQVDLLLAPLSARPHDP
jgi:hypothetical protein